MKWAYDLCGAEPIIKDEVVYDAALIDYGELLMLATGDFTAGVGGGGGLITAYSTTAPGAHAIDAVGISLERKTTADSPSIATATDTTAAPCYVKTIINPFAVYRAECVTSEMGSITSWAGTHVVIAGHTSVADYMGWVYFANSAGPNFGELRSITNSSAADTIELDAGPAATATTADKVIFILNRNNYANGLDTTAVGVTAQSGGTLGVSGGTNMRIVETYCDSDTGFRRMTIDSYHLSSTAATMNLKKAGSKAAKFYNDIMLKDHAFGVQEN